MNVHTKLIISTEELDAMKNADFFLTKHAVTAKIYAQFASLKEELKQSGVHQSFPFPAKADIHTGKISKGENYRLLPYIVLDFPRYFNNEGIFAFRSLFWWGNFFSFTLHLSGSFLENYREKLLNHRKKLLHKKVYLCTADSQWEHHFEKDNYTLVDKMDKKTLEQLIAEKEFIKLSRKLRVEEWKKINASGKESYELFLKAMV